MIRVKVMELVVQLSLIEFLCLYWYIHIWVDCLRLLVIMWSWAITLDIWSRWAVKKYGVDHIFDFSFLCLSLLYQLFSLDTSLVSVFGLKCKLKSWYLLNDSEAEWRSNMLIVQVTIVKTTDLNCSQAWRKVRYYNI